MEVSRLTTTSFEDLNTSNNDIRTWENTSETQELTQEQSNVILTDDAGIQGDTKWVGMDFHHNAHSTADNNNLKIAQRDGDVSPNGHRVRGSSSSTFLLDTGKDIWFSCEYGSSGGSDPEGTAPSGDGGIIDRLQILNTRTPR